MIEPHRRPPMLAAGPRGARIAVADAPRELFAWGLVDHDAVARLVADHIGLGHWCDDLAWDAIFTDAERLFAHKAVYGNRKRS